MPTAGKRWLPHAIECELPSGTRIAAVSPPFLIATKLEAFAGRGRGDYLGSRDFADIVSLLDGRAEIVDEMRTSPNELRGLAEELQRHRAHPRFLDASTADSFPTTRVKPEPS